MDNNLKNRYNPKCNSFTIISIIMSLLILYFHSYPLFYGAMTSNCDLISKFFVSENLASLIVSMFFIISGFMITSSIKKSRSTFEYIKKRVIKIFPPLIVCLVICAIVISPIISDYSKLQFVKTPSLYIHYIVDNILLFKNTDYNIADVFIHNPYPSAINGSLWTIKHQFTMYLLMILINYLFLKKDTKNNKYKYYFFILLIITAVSYTGYYDIIFTKVLGKIGFIGIFNEGKYFLRWGYYFCAGVFMNVYSSEIKTDKITIAVMLAIAILTMRTPFFTYTCLILLPYFTLYLGSIKCDLKLIDISYETYIWGFPIQQLLMYYFNGKITIYEYIALSMIITIIVGFVFYYITEYPFKIIRKKMLKKES